MGLIAHAAHIHNACLIFPLFHLCIIHQLSPCHAHIQKNKRACLKCDRLLLSSPYFATQLLSATLNLTIINFRFSVNSAAASAYGIPACLITNFTFDEVYRFLREGDTLDKDVMAVADAALEDYKKASLLLRLPGSIDIPSFEDEILAMETSRSNGSPSISDMDDTEEDHRILSLSTMQEQEHDLQQQHQRQQLQAHSKTKEEGNGVAPLAMDVDEHYRRHSAIRQHSNDTIMGDTTPTGIMSPATSTGTTVSSPNPSIIGRFRASSFAAGSDSSLSMTAASPMASKVRSLTRKVVDVPLVVRMAVNTREDVLRSLGVDELTIATKKMVLVSFGGQRLKQGWGNPLPEGWIGVICGLPVEHELPEGFYRSPHGVYVPDLTRAADIVIGKLVCSLLFAHGTTVLNLFLCFIPLHANNSVLLLFSLSVFTGLWNVLGVHCA